MSHYASGVSELWLMLSGGAELKLYFQLSYE